MKTIQNESDEWITASAQQWGNVYRTSSPRITYGHLRRILFFYFKYIYTGYNQSVKLFYLGALSKT